jgi:hypothetical protein
VQNQAGKGNILRYQKIDIEPLQMLIAHMQYLPDIIPIS